MTDTDKIKEPLWDKEEWIILIANLQKNNFQPLEEIQKEQISKVLKRYLSIKNNFKPIDEGYRNVNGINWQSNNLLKYLNTNNSNIHLSRAAIKTLTYYKDNYEELRKETKKLMFKIDYAFDHKVHFGKFNFLCNDIHKYELTIRTLNVLKNREIDFIYELIFYTGGELLRFSNFGRNSLEEIEEFLKNEFKLTLATNIYSKEFKKKHSINLVSQDIDNEILEADNEFNYDLPELNEDNLILQFYDSFNIEVLSGRIINSSIDKNNQLIDLSLFSARTLNILNAEEILRNYQVIELYEQGKRKILGFQNSGIKTFNEIEEYVKKLKSKNIEKKETKFLSKTEISYFLQPLNIFTPFVDLDIKLLKNLGIDHILDLYIYSKSKDFTLPDYFIDYLRCFVGLKYEHSSINLEKIKAPRLDENKVFDLMANISKKILKPKEFEVIKFRFGFYGEDKMTLEQIANLPNFGVTREMIRQTEAKALKKLRLQKNKFNQIYLVALEYLESKIFKHNVFQEEKFSHSNILVFLVEVIYKKKLNWLSENFYKIKNCWLNLNFNDEDYIYIEKIIKKNEKFPIFIDDLIKDVNLDKKYFSSYFEINKSKYIFENNIVIQNEGYNKARRRLRVYSLIREISLKSKSIFRIENIFFEYKRRFKDDDDVFYRDIHQILRFEFQDSGVVQNFKDNVLYFITDNLDDLKVKKDYLRLINYQKYYDKYYSDKETIKVLYDYLKLNGPKRIYEITDEFQKMHNIPKGSTTRYLSTNGGFHKLLPGLIGISEHIDNKKLIKNNLSDSQTIENYILLRHAGCNEIDFPYLSLECDQIIAEYLIKNKMSNYQRQFSKLSLIEKLLPSEKKYYLNLQSSLKESYEPISNDFENYIYNLDEQILRQIIILSLIHKSISFIYINKYVLGTRFQSLKFSLPYMICLDALGLLKEFKYYYEKVPINENRLKKLLPLITHKKDKELSNIIIDELDFKNMVFFNEEDLDKISFNKKLKNEITDFDLYDF